MSVKDLLRFSCSKGLWPTISRCVNGAIVQNQCKHATSIQKCTSNLPSDQLTSDRSKAFWFGEVTEQLRWTVLRLVVEGGMGDARAKRVVPSMCGIPFSMSQQDRCSMTDAPISEFRAMLPCPRCSTLLSQPASSLQGTSTMVAISDMQAWGMDTLIAISSPQEMSSRFLALNKHTVSLVSLAGLCSNSKTLLLHLLPDGLLCQVTSKVSARNSSLDLRMADLQRAFFPDRLIHSSKMLQRARQSLKMESPELQNFDERACMLAKLCHLIVQCRFNCL